MMTTSKARSLAGLGILLAGSFFTVPAQQTDLPAPSTSPGAPRAPVAPGLPIAPRVPKTTFGERYYGSTSLPASRSMRLLVDNRTAGRITVIGGNTETIEAHAVSERGDEVLIVSEVEVDGDRKIFIKADYASLEDAESKTKELGPPPLVQDVPVLVHLEVRVPRYTELEWIKVIRSHVSITGVDAPVGIISQYSKVTLKDVGSSEISSRSGSIEIENAKGVTEARSVSGAIRVSNSEGAVRLGSISGPIEVRCIKGRVEVTNTQASIDLTGIDGDVDANVISSTITFRGPLRGDARYILKSMSGRVEMLLPAETTGFNAVLTAYRGMVESDFPLPNNTASATQPDTAGPRRLSGQIGKGSAQILLDTFDGVVRLSKSGEAMTPCK